MDLSTTYLGLELKNPIIPSASPLSKNIDNIKKMEDAGAAAVVMYSLFEEEIVHDELELYHHTTIHNESFAEAMTYFPEVEHYMVGAEEYLNHIRKAKEKVSIPIIASLNGSTNGGWVDYAKKIEQAGADAIELNMYMLAADTEISSAEIEELYLDTINTVRSCVNIPIAMKLSPYFSSFAGFAKKLDDSGADGLVLFNRFYQPDIDLENLEVVPNIILSSPQSMRLPLRWIAILYGKIKADMAATSGIYTAEDVIKMMMVGAKVTELFAVLHERKIEYIEELINNIISWMDEHEYESIEQMRGSMSHRSVADPGAFERANYMKALRSFK